MATFPKESAETSFKSECQAPDESEGEVKRTSSYCSAVDLPVNSSDLSDQDLLVKAANATQYKPPQYRRRMPASLDTSISGGDSTPAYEKSVASPLTPGFSQPLNHSVIIVTGETQDGNKSGCPFSGCDGCKEPLTCGFMRQYDSSLLVTYIRGTETGLVRPDLINENAEIHSRLVAEAQRWERETQKKAEGGLVIHNVTGTDTLQGLAIKYSVSTAAIRRANRMNGTDIISYRTLKIPTTVSASQVWSPSPGPRALAVLVRVAMINKVKHLAKVTFDEARVLLDLNEYDIEAAVAENTEWMNAESGLRGTVNTAKTLKDWINHQASA